LRVSRSHGDQTADLLSATASLNSHDSSHHRKVNIFDHTVYITAFGPHQLENSRSQGARFDGTINFFIVTDLFLATDTALEALNNLPHEV
jgi:adenosylcobinamide amidohydrolase